MEHEQITPKQALDALTAAMTANPDYAWSWHANLAMLAVDAGAPHKEANERAAGFMWSTFGVCTHSMIVEGSPSVAHHAKARPPADIPRDVLLDKSLREYAHELRREACSAWSAVAVPCDRIDEAKCEYANAVERRLKVVINELADLSAAAQPPAASVTVDAVMRVIDGQRRLPYRSIDEKQAFRNELEAALATQENPNG